MAYAALPSDAASYDRQGCFHQNGVRRQYHFRPPSTLTGVRPSAADYMREHVLVPNALIQEHTIKTAHIANVDPESKLNQALQIRRLQAPELLSYLPERFILYMLKGRVNCLNLLVESHACVFNMFYRWTGHRHCRLGH